MTEIRKAMVDKMIKLYGFEDERTIEFTRIAESWPNNKKNNEILEAIVVESHIQCYEIINRETC